MKESATIDTQNAASANSAPTYGVQPYLFFGGRCEEALNYYRDALGADVTCMMRFSECPDPLDPEMCPPEHHNRIMHAAFHLGATEVFASDGCPSDAPKTGNVSLSLSVATNEEAEQRFNALAEKGQVLMPMNETFFATRFGIVIDRYDISWMVIAPKEMPAG